MHKPSRVEAGAPGASGQAIGGNVRPLHAAKLECWLWAVLPLPLRTDP